MNPRHPSPHVADAPRPSAQDNAAALASAEQTATASPKPTDSLVDRYTWRDDGGEALVAQLKQDQDALGITDADAEQVVRDLIEEKIKFRDVFGLSDNEMACMEYKAHEWLKQKQPQQRLKIFLGLIKLNRYEARYYSGAAMCFQHMREYGFAHNFYRMAIVTSPASEIISELLSAECLVHLEGRKAGLEAFQRALAKVSADPTPSSEEAPFIERARLACNALQTSLSAAAKP